MDHEEDAPTSSMQGILAVAHQVHQRELDKRDEQIHALQQANQKLKSDHASLEQRYADLRRLSIEEKGHMISANQHYEQKLASAELQIKGLESELNRSQQEHTSQVAHLTSERDKANHIIKNLLNKVRHSPAH